MVIGHRMVIITLETITTEITIDFNQITTTIIITIIIIIVRIAIIIIIITIEKKYHR